MTYRVSGMDAPTQSLKQAETQPTPLGPRHLHYSFRDGEGRWVVRSRRNALCGTLRCRLVLIYPEGGG